MEDNMQNEMDVTLMEQEAEGRFARGMRHMRGLVATIGAQNLVIACSLLLIGAAVITNFVMFGGDGPAVGEGDVLGSGLIEEGGEALTAKSSPADAYFASAQLSRKQARDQALAVLQTVVDSASADALAREQASDDISRIASEMQTEANVETLIKSKGFEECVAVIAEGSASIIVRSDGLLPNELSQIKEIVYEHAGIDPVSIKIIEQRAE